MFNIKKKPYGFKMLFDGIIYKPELQEWGKEVEATLAGQDSPFCVFFDARSLFPFNATAQQPAADTLMVMRKAGLQRCVVAYKEKPVQVIWDRLAKWAGISPGMRYIDATSQLNWEELGLKWIEAGIDPNK